MPVVFVRRLPSATRVSQAVALTPTRRSENLGVPPAPSGVDGNTGLSGLSPGSKGSGEGGSGPPCVDQTL